MFYTDAILRSSSLPAGPPACADWIRVPQDSGASTDREHALQKNTKVGIHATVKESLEIVAQSRQLGEQLGFSLEREEAKF